jgi:hypothetical protein
MKRALPLLAVVCALPAWASPACPSPQEMTEQHLFGQWRAELEGGESATLRLHKNPELAQSVAGEVQRGSARAQLAGDVDEGEFLVEESQDGKRISAVWSGKVVEGSCGKEIKGTWTDHRDERTRSFVLRKTPGWQ